MKEIIIDPRCNEFKCLLKEIEDKLGMIEFEIFEKNMQQSLFLGHAHYNIHEYQHYKKGEKTNIPELMRKWFSLICRHTFYGDLEIIHHLPQYPPRNFS